MPPPRMLDPGLSAQLQTPPADRLRTRAVTSEPGRTATWDVVGHPFRIVAIGRSWVVVPVGDRSRSVLIRADLLAHRFPTRTAALRTLGAVLAEQPA